MADVKISALPAAAPLGGTEAVPCVQSAATVKTTPAAILTYVLGDGSSAGSAGFRVVPSNPQSAAYSTVLADSGKSIDHLAADANARTFTIDGSVSYPVGTCISFTNMTSQVVTIAISTDTLYLAGAGTTGSRSLAQYGVATARKQASGVWIISGIGLA